MAAYDMNILILGFIAASLLAVAVILREIIKGKVRAVKVRVDFINKMQKKLR